MKRSTDKSTRKPCATEPQTVAGFLATALNMEDQISRGVYKDYLNRKNWPAQLNDATFRQVQKRLNTLLKDTERHYQILRALIDEYGQTHPHG